MKLRKWIALLMSMVLLLGLLAGCVQPEPNDPTSPNATQPGVQNPTQPAQTKYLKLALTLSETLSGLRSTYGNGNHLNHRLLFTSLFEYDLEKQEYVNALADKLEVSDDGLVYTVTLGDHKFHDGTPITADDVVFTFTMGCCIGSSDKAKLAQLIGYKEAQAGEATTVPGIKKIDDKTVTFTLANPDSLFISGLASSYHAIIPAKYFEGMTPAEVSENPTFWAKPVGSGPFKINEVNYPSYITLTRFDEYYKPAGFKDVLMTYYADTASRDAAYAAGELDYGTNFDATVAANLCAQNSDLVQVVVPSTYGRWFAYNYSGSAGENGKSHPGLSDSRVRHAINMALDKEAISSLFAGLATPLTTRIYSASPDYNSDIPLWKRDVEGAKKLLKEANFDFSIPLRVYSNYENQVTTDLMELVTQNLADVGITVTYVQDKNHANYLPTTDYDLRLVGGMYPNVIEMYNGLCMQNNGNAASSNYPVADSDFVKYMTPRYDDLVNEYKRISDPARQKEIIDQLQYNAYEDMPQCPLHTLDNINIHNKAHVSGIPDYARDYEQIIDLKLDQWKLVG